MGENNWMKNKIDTNEKDLFSPDWIFLGHYVQALGECGGYWFKIKLVEVQWRQNSRKIECGVAQPHLVFIINHSLLFSLKLFILKVLLVLQNCYFRKITGSLCNKSAS